MSATRILGIPLAALLLLAATSRVRAQDYDSESDPPDRVAQLDYLSGDVQFAPSGTDDWGDAYRNRPLGTGDRLYTGDEGRAALDLGDAALRLDAQTAVNVLELDDQAAQFELSQGTLNLRVRRMDRGQTYEVDTPTVAFVVDQPGDYRIDVGDGRDGAQVTVFSGAGVVYGEGGDSREVGAGRSYRFDGAYLDDMSEMGLPRGDDFDRFCYDRDYRYDHSRSRRYVSADMIGYDDLDDYGDWSNSDEYGEVWYPRQVAYGWAPYRDGRWEWIDPWGWTWVDDTPWGFAPSHYGRWAWIDHRWGWIPGGTRRGAVYAPALVAFIGAIAFGDSQPVGWFPLGPRDVYRPWYRVSRGYFTSVNVTNVRVINQTVINNYYTSYVNNTTIVNPPAYANRVVPNAVTVVSRATFTGARPVAAAMLRMQPNALAQAKVTPTLRIAPSLASIGAGRAAAQASRNTVPASLFTRSVVARRTPPPAPAPLEQRLHLIASQGGQPLATAQLHALRRSDAQSHPQPQRVRIVGAVANPGVPRPQAPLQMNPAQTVPRGSDRTTAQYLRPGELPSARYAHPAQAPASELPPRRSERPTGSPQREVPQDGYSGRMTAPADANPNGQTAPASRGQALPPPRYGQDSQGAARYRPTNGYQDNSNSPRTTVSNPAPDRALDDQGQARYRDAGDVHPRVRANDQPMRDASQAQAANPSPPVRQYQPQRPEPPQPTYAQPPVRYEQAPRPQPRVQQQPQPVAHGQSNERPAPKNHEDRNDKGKDKDKDDHHE